MSKAKMKDLAPSKERAKGGTMGSPVMKVECGIHVETKDT
jgi:hypothetical protein